MSLEGFFSINEDTTLIEVQELIKSGADLNAKNERYCTPLIWAVSNSCPSG